MTTRIFESPYVTLDELRERRVVVMKRTATAFAAPTALVQAYQDALGEPLRDGRYREWALIVDMRDAPGRNDPDFEAATAAFRKQAMVAFRKAVLLIATATGALQVNRLAKQDGVHFTLASDMEHALRIATAP